jgi:hypothetical protein
MHVHTPILDRHGHQTSVVIERGAHDLIPTSLEALNYVLLLLWCRLLTLLRTLNPVIPQTHAKLFHDFFVLLDGLSIHLDGGVASSTVVPVPVLGHEDSWTT